MTDTRLQHLEIEDSRLVKLRVDLQAAQAERDRLQAENRTLREQLDHGSAEWQQEREQLLERLKPQPDIESGVLTCHIPDEPVMWAQDVECIEHLGLTAWRRTIESVRTDDDGALEQTVADLGDTILVELEELLDTSLSAMQFTAGCGRVIVVKVSRPTGGLRDDPRYLDVLYLMLPLVRRVRVLLQPYYAVARKYLVDWDTLAYCDTAYDRTTRSSYYSPADAQCLQQIPLALAPGLLTPSEFLCVVSHIRQFLVDLQGVM